MSLSSVTLFPNSSIPLWKKLLTIFADTNFKPHDKVIGISRTDSILPAQLRFARKEDDTFVGRVVDARRHVGAGWTMFMLFKTFSEVLY